MPRPVGACTQGGGSERPTADGHARLFPEAPADDPVERPEQVQKPEVEPALVARQKVRECEIWSRSVQFGFAAPRDRARPPVHAGVFAAGARVERQTFSKGEDAGTGSVRPVSSSVFNAESTTGHPEPTIW